MTMETASLWTSAHVMINTICLIKSRNQVKCPTEGAHGKQTIFIEVDY